MKSFSLSAYTGGGRRGGLMVSALLLEKEEGNSPRPEALKNQGRYEKMLWFALDRTLYRPHFTIWGTRMSCGSTSK